MVHAGLAARLQMQTLRQLCYRMWTSAWSIWYKLQRYVRRSSTVARYAMLQQGGPLYLPAPLWHRLKLQEVGLQVAQLKAIHEKVLETAALMQARGKAMESLPSQYEGGDSNTDFLTTLNGLADSQLESCRYGHRPCSQENIRRPSEDAGCMRVVGALALRMHSMTNQLLDDTDTW